MSRIPCRKCPKCGRYNDFTMDKCKCGEELREIGAHFIDIDDISSEQKGEINTTLKVYVQKCSYCGALSFTDAPDKRVMRCYKCTKDRIAGIAPTECREEKSKERQDDDLQESEEINGKCSFQMRQTVKQVTQSQPDYSEDEEDDDDNDFGLFQEIYKKLKKTVGNTDKDVFQETVSIEAELKNNEEAENFYDDDDDAVVDWAPFLKITPKQNTLLAPTQQEVLTSERKNITLTAIGYGQLSFTIEASENPYMLGRSANQATFLGQDDRVGNEHCYLFFRNRNWIVKDNQSKNGTLVNSQDIGENGEYTLSDGDELKLGHKPDSVAFRITIK